MLGTAPLTAVARGGADMAAAGSETALRRANADQRKAADTAVSVWVGASAGTGKTKVLTDRVLSLLLDGTLPQRILCLTFTRAAAAEMANRVRERLGEWAIASDEALADAIRDLNGTEADGALLGRARRLFGMVLECPGGLKIQTIHAFCESLLRRFPVEAGVQPHFQLVDERTAREFLAAAREEVLARAMNRSAPEGAAPMDGLAGALGEISARVNGEEFHKLMGRLADDRGRLARLFARWGGAEGVSSALARRLGVDPGQGEETLIAAACEDGAFDAPALRKVTALMERGSNTDQKRAAAMAAFLSARAEHRPPLLDGYRGAFLNKDGNPFSRPVTKGALAEADDPEAVLAALGTEAQRLITLQNCLKDMTTFRASAAVLTLGAHLVEAYETHKQALSRLDYEDLILSARNLLEGSDAAQWVLFKLDGGIDHILVDEAQDTSPDQWGIIQALSAEFFAGEGARDAPRTVFAVGDAKQSIYSFQRADPRAFEEMRHFFNGRAQAAARRWSDVDLSVSFRSTSAVLEAVDAVFVEPSARDGLAEGGGEIRHHTVREGQGGLVELWPVVTPEKPHPADPWAPSAAETTGIGAPEHLAVRIATTIADWIERKEILESRARPIGPGDIMILVRRRTAFVDHLVRALKRLAVPVAGVDRLILTEELAVMDLLALGRFALLPEDDLTLACVLKGPFVGLDEESLFDLAYGRGGSLWVALTERARDGGPYEAARDWLGEVLARADIERPYEFFASVLNRDGGRGKLVGRLGQEVEDPVNEFLELALAFERGQPPSLEGFLAWVKAGQAEIKRDLEQAVRDEVRVMTVHGAKGLQAPIVFLPDTTQKPRAQDLPYWAPPGNGVETELPLWAPRSRDYGPLLADLRREAAAAQERESHRLLYVAMTRAEDRLYVCGWEGFRRRDEGCWYNLIDRGLRAVPGVEIHDAVGGLPVEDAVTPALRLRHPQEAAPKSPKSPPRGEKPVLDTAWAAHPPAPESVPSRPLAPSDPGDEPPASGPAAGDSGFLIRGRVVHALLQYLPGLDPGVRPAAARRYLARPVLGLSPEDGEKIAKETLDLLDDPAFSELFAPGSLAEVPVTGVVDGVAVSGQVDRLTVSGGTVLVADYKTGRACPDGIDSVPAAYMRQMALYRALIEQALPAFEIRCALVYTSGPRLFELPNDRLDEALGGAVA